MKKVVFICSHLFSGSQQLYAAMNRNPRIQGYKLKNLNTYENGLNLIGLMENPHKASSSSAIYMDEICFNHQISTKSVYSFCKFIYVVRSPEHCLSQMVGRTSYSPSCALRYYTFRLRRICEMASKTSGAILLTYDDLVRGSGVDLINKQLELRVPIDFNPDSLSYLRKSSVGLMGSGLLSIAQDSYERYLYFLKNQSLHRPQ